MTKAAKLEILSRLEQMYPEAKAELVFSNPYEMLVATMLSAQCTDKQVNKVTPAVFSRWPDASAMAEELTAFYKRPEIIITRKTKRGEGEMDIVPAIRDISFSMDNEGKFVQLGAVISAQEPTLNPDHLIAALRQLVPEIAPDFAAFTRRQVYLENGEVFR